jgi:hypothetical protein
MKLLEIYDQQLKDIKSTHEAKFGKLKKLISELSYQQSSILYKLQPFYSKNEYHKRSLNL